jgi:type I restriction enzyme S subunit
MAGGVKWTTKRLGELAEFRNGVNYNKSSFGVGVKVVGVSDFQDYSKPRYAELEQINPEGIVTERNILRDGDIVFVRSNGNRELIGRSLFIEHPPEEITHSAFTIRLRFTAREILPKFYAYCFRTPLIRQALTAQGGGTNINNLNQDILNALEVPSPPLAVQRRIAGILSAYDELIENSQRRIEILQAMARALYREWFVQFRFPGHENHPRVTSPVGDIPKGWATTTFGEIYNTSSGGTPSRKRPEYFQDGSIDWVKSQELLDGFILGTEERITPEALENSSAKVFPANTVLVALYGATIGKLAILAGEAATNQACCAVLPKLPAYRREFAFLTLFTNRERIIGLRLGAAQQNISQVLIKNFECVKPSPAIAGEFAERTAPMFDGILTLQRQIQNLRRTRDLLLPRLLSGQVNLKEG